MNRKGDKSLIVGLDIGTSKVVALVGEYSPGNPIEVIGIGSHESRGLKRGVVVDIESTVESIKRAVEEADLMAGCEIRSVYASISGNHVQCRNSQGLQPIREGEVTWADLDRVLEAAKAVAIPADQRILHAVPREYVLDDSQEGIRNPVGMTGVRLEVHAHLVTCAQSAAQNITKCVQRCGLQVDELVLSSLASSMAVLTADERELGVVLVDMGAGTTDISVYVQGALCHSASLPIAGDHVTNDIAHMLRTPTPEAEQIKVRYACALAQLATAEESIQVPSVGDRPPRRMPRHSLAQAVQGVTRKFLKWSRPSCAAPASRSWYAPGWCSPVAPRRWKGWSNWPRKCCRCRCASAFRSMFPAWAKWSATRCTPPRSACC